MSMSSTGWPSTMWRTQPPTKRAAMPPWPARPAMPAPAARSSRRFHLMSLPVIRGRCPGGAEGEGHTVFSTVSDLKLARIATEALPSGPAGHLPRKTGEQKTSTRVMARRGRRIPDSGEEHQDEAAMVQTRPAMASQVMGMSCQPAGCGQLALLLDLTATPTGRRRRSAPAPALTPTGRFAWRGSKAFCLASVSRRRTGRTAGFSAYRQLRPRCSARRRAWRSSAARGPARCGFGWWFLSSRKCASGTSNTSATSRGSHGRESRRHDAHHRLIS